MVAAGLPKAVLSPEPAAGTEGRGWLYVVGSREAAGQRPLPEILGGAARAGAAFVQVREPGMDDGELVRLAGEVVTAVRGTGARVLVNDRVDIALAAGADGVHLKASGLAAGRARDLFEAAGRTGAVLARSTHELEEVERARREGVDLLVFGPVFDTPSKRRYGPPQGIERLQRACAVAGGLPVLAIGGVDETRAASCLAAGARGIAVIRAVVAAADPEAAARRLVGAMTPSPAPSTIESKERSE